MDKKNKQRFAVTGYVGVDTVVAYISATCVEEAADRAEARFDDGVMIFRAAEFQRHGFDARRLD